MTTPDSGWEGDVNEAARESWVSETTPFERVRTTVLSTTTPQPVSELAERAAVSEPTARKHLEQLVDAGIAARSETSRGAAYKRSRETVVLQRLKDLHESLSREALTAGIRDLRERIAAFEAEYDATDPDDLALQLAAGDDGWEDVVAWRAAETDLDVAQAALSLYDFDPDGESNASSDRGSLEGDSASV